MEQFLQVAWVLFPRGASEFNGIGRCGSVRASAATIFYATEERPKDMCFFEAV